MLHTKNYILNDPRVQDLCSEYDDEKSWWCYLKKGWIAYNNQREIHENTIKEICDILNYDVKEDLK